MDESRASALNDMTRRPAGRCQSSGSVIDRANRMRRQRNEVRDLGQRTLSREKGLEKSYTGLETEEEVREGLVARMSDEAARYGL